MIFSEDVKLLKRKNICKNCLQVWDKQKTRFYRSSKASKNNRQTTRSLQSVFFDDDHASDLNLNSDVLYVEYEEEEEEERKKSARRQRAKSPDAPRRVLSLVK